MRQVSRRALARLRRLPTASEGARLLDELGSSRELGRSARSLIESLRSLPKRRPGPFLDTVLGWVVAESASFLGGNPVELPRLVFRVRDLALVALTVAPAIALL
jgi:hypothetical protein